MKRSGHLQQRDVRTQVLLDMMQRTMKQYMLDTLLITMHGMPEGGLYVLRVRCASRKRRQPL